MSTFQNKTVLITGGASGIGKLMASLALQKGAKVILWDINTTSIQATLSEFQAMGTIFGYTVDITDLEAVKATAVLVKNNHGTVDILINNAGIVVGKYFHEHTHEEINRTMAINANAPMHLTLEFLEGMLAQNSGHVCTIASSAGLISNPKMSVYAASKWSAIGWSDSLRLEMKQLKKNIGVTTVTPYYINTGMFDGVKSIVPILNPEKVANQIIRGIERNKIFVSMPWSVGFVRFFQGLLPIRVFDWLVGDVMGVYATMNHFKGRQ